MATLDTNHPDRAAPHCPDPTCKHHNDLQDGWEYISFGYYLRNAYLRRIRRYKCKTCGDTFSSQSFATTYYLKRPDILPQLMTRAVGGMS